MYKNFFVKGMQAFFLGNVVNDMVSFKLGDVKMSGQRYLGFPKVGHRKKKIGPRVSPLITPID